tara:strand:- start:182 stop:601 length:420 start_codon:yes stop_codon:yes gene_type:complete
MAANTVPIFTLTPNTVTASISAANTASDGSGSLVTLFTAGANGSRVDSITFQNAQIALAASSAMVCRVFVTDTSGANPRLISEVAQAAATRSASVIGATTTITYGNGLLLASGQLLKVIQSVYAGVQDLQHAIARGGDY